MPLKIGDMITQKIGIFTYDAKITKVYPIITNIVNSGDTVTYVQANGKEVDALVTHTAGDGPKGQMLNLNIDGKILDNVYKQSELNERGTWKVKLVPAKEEVVEEV